jgi:hypothetical protein
MKLHALLAWFNEPDDMLARAVASCAGVADHLVAIDGPYQSFPHRTTRSRSSERATILRACRKAGVECTIVQPGVAWLNEGAKRTALFQMAALLGSIHDDWVVPIDADEELVNGHLLREYVENAPASHQAAAFTYVTPDADMDADERAVTDAGTETRTMTQVRALRLVPGLRVQQPTHYLFEHDGGVITSPDHTFVESGFHILHHTMSRGMDRKQAKAEHIKMRTMRGEQ